MQVCTYIHEPMTTRKNMCTSVCVYTLAGGDTLFEIPRESAGEREKSKRKREPPNNEREQQHGA